MAAYVLTCDEANVVPASSTSAGTVPASCTSAYFAPEASLLPSLSITDGITISLGVLVVWAIGFGIKSIRRTLSHS